MPVELCIIIVSWNVADLLMDCLRSIALGGIPEDDLRIVVVDNASSDDSVARLSSGFPKVDVVQNPSNLGFTRANNQALRSCVEPYILLLNPDTIVQPGALHIMLEFMRTHEHVGVIGPHLVYGDGRPQPSRR
ncbi:MAG: glycosyltransferase, partial [Anaerolineae bacterium]